MTDDQYTYLKPKTLAEVQSSPNAARIHKMADEGQANLQAERDHRRSELTEIRRLDAEIFRKLDQPRDQREPFTPEERTRLTSRIAELRKALAPLEAACFPTKHSVPVVDREQRKPTLEEFHACTETSEGLSWGPSALTADDAVRGLREYVEHLRADPD